MARPSAEPHLRPRLEAYLASAAVRASTDAPINLSAVAHALGVDRRTIRAHFAREIAAAAARQRKQRTPSARETERQSFQSLATAREAAIDALTRRVHALTGRLALVEHNAVRLGIDPEQLFQPIRKPDRSTPRMRRRHRA